MWILITGLLILAFLAFALGYIRNRNLQKKINKGELETFPEVRETDVECCGQHAVCEKESLLAAVSSKIVYYDDEELDVYVGTPANRYTDEQIELFRNILCTMQETDVAGWVRSLQLRGIELPDELKDEVFLIVGERRFQ